MRRQEQVYPEKNYIFMMELKNSGYHSSIYKSRLPYRPNVPHRYNRNLSSHKCQSSLNLAKIFRNVIKNYYLKIFIQCTKI